jgi:hypothetical protein
MTDKKTFKSDYDAWKWIHEMFPGTQWYLDHESSERAGYKIYRDIEEFYNYVCELGDRVEVNLKEGNRTINLWIEKEEPDVKGSEPATWYKLTNSEVGRICSRLYNAVAILSSEEVEKGSFDGIYDIMEDLKLIDRLRNPVIDDSDEKN